MEVHVEEQVAPRLYSVNTQQEQVRRNRRNLLEFLHNMTSFNESPPITDFAQQ